MLNNSDINFKKISGMSSLFFILILTPLLFISAHPIDNSTMWSNWMSLEDSGISWRYHCDSEIMEGKYRTFFEFSRSDVKSKRKGTRTYAHVRLDFEGFSYPIRASFIADSKKEWRYMTIRLNEDNLNFTSRVGYSQYRNQPTEWSE